MTTASLYTAAIDLLKELISIQSFSREEDKTADAIARFMESKGVETKRFGNNIYAFNKHYDAGKKTILLNSHHDTVKPNKGYMLDPFTPIEKEGRLYGLGSNDAGGCLVSLLSCFLYFYNQEGLGFNLCFAASAEEEVSGKGGIEALLPHLGQIDCGIVGEPTLMDMAIAEKGLMVVDCEATGVAGHAAREEGENAIYKALKDIAWISDYQFPKVSPLLGPVKMSVTIIGSGTQQHNIVPDKCSFTIDVRLNECYTHEEALAIISNNISATASARSMRLRSTSIPTAHVLVQAGLAMGRQTYGSATMSDKALMPFPALKMGPGDSARSHTADEFIYLEEIRKGIEEYVALLERVL